MHDMALSPRLHTISLCAGVGGLDLGVRLAEPAARCVCYVEREAPVASILVARMEDGWLHPAPIWSDLATFDAGAWRGAVDCVLSGDPCQPNSVAGRGLAPTTIDGSRGSSSLPRKRAGECGRTARIFRLGTGKAGLPRCGRTVQREGAWVQPRPRAHVPHGRPCGRRTRTVPACMGLGGWIFGQLLRPGRRREHRTGKRLARTCGEARETCRSRLRL